MGSFITIFLCNVLVMVCTGGSQAIGMARAKVADYLVCYYKRPASDKQSFISNLQNESTASVLNAVGDLGVFIQNNKCVYLANNLTQETKARTAACTYIKVHSPRAGVFKCGSYSCDTGAVICSPRCTGGYVPIQKPCGCICNQSYKKCPAGTVVQRTNTTCSCVKLVAKCSNGAALTQNAFNYAMDAVSAQYLFYVTCNLHSRCDCDTYCNDESHRVALYTNFINNIKRDASLQKTIFNLTCAIQLGQSASTKQNLIVQAAKRLMSLNGRAYKSGCTGRPCDGSSTHNEGDPPHAGDPGDVTETPPGDGGKILGLDPSLAMGGAVVLVMLVMVMQK